MKKVFAILFCIILGLSTIGCGKKETKININETTANQEGLVVAIHAGDSDIYIDEARYYAYNTQGTYETYYLTEGQEIDWGGEKTKEMPFQQIVKSTVLDDMCRRECMYELADEYNVKLTDEEINSINKNVNNFFKKSNKKLKNKIDISKERLSVVFQKAEIAKKVEGIMNTENKDKADNTYKKWKEEHTVTADKIWEDINYNEPIFTKKDINKVSNK